MREYEKVSGDIMAPFKSHKTLPDVVPESQFAILSSRHARYHELYARVHELIGQGLNSSYAGKNYRWREI